jgi:hypothetical protein
MYNELSKSQKKIARILINKGLEIEYGNCLEKVNTNRYVRGSAYFITVLGSYMDDILSEEDSADFDKDIKNRLIGLKQELNK